MTIEKRNGAYRVVARYRGFKPYTQTLGEGPQAKKDARLYDDALRGLAEAQRHDVYEALADGHVTMSQILRALQAESASLLDLTRIATGPDDLTLGQLVDEWALHIKSPGTIAPRTRRPYARATLERYREGWANFYKHHPKGRLARPGTLTTAALKDFRSARTTTDRVSMATVNRDLTAVQAFLRWLREEREYVLPRPPRVQKGLEHDYTKDVRHLEPEQWAALRPHLPKDWRPFFDTLIYSGLRLGEGQALKYGDVSRREDRDATGTHVMRFISVQKGKTNDARREVPVMQEIVPWADAVIDTAALPFAFVWPEPMRDRTRAWKTFVDACIQSGLHDQGKAASEKFEEEHETWDAEHRSARRKWERLPERDRLGEEPPVEPVMPDPLPIEALFSPHSLRHSFGVACARAGLTLLEIAELLGHSSIVPTARYAKFMPLDLHRRAQALRISAAFAQRPSVQTQVSPQSPQTDA